MIDDTLYEKLIQTSIRFVSYRPRSEKEIRDFLTSKLKRWKTAGSFTLTKIIERLRELQYIDDEKFAKWWVEQRNRFRPKGTMLLVRELVQKGISREIIEEVLSESKGNETERAKNVALKKLTLLKKLPKLEQKKKLYGYLGRRGYSSEVVHNVVDEVTGSEV